MQQDVTISVVPPDAESHGGRDAEGADGPTRRAGEWPIYGTDQRVVPSRPPLTCSPHQKVGGCGSRP